MHAVDGPTLAVLVPLLQRALGSRATVVQRQTSTFIANLFKLVRSPELAAHHMPSLLPGVVRVAEGAAFPEVRAFANEAVRAIVDASGADDSVIEAAKKADTSSPAASVPQTPAVKLEDEDALLAQKTLGDLLTKSGSPPDAFVNTSLAYQAYCVSQLVRKRDFADDEWTKYTVPYLSHFVSKDVATSISAENLKRWLAIDAARTTKDEAEDDDGVTAEKIVDVNFSLAYGGLLLLNHTTLRLRKGMRYAACGSNGCGKSTLLVRLACFSAFFEAHKMSRCRKR